MDIADGTTIKEKCPECGSKVIGVITKDVANFQCPVEVCKTQWHYSVNARRPSDKKRAKFTTDWYKDYLKKQ
jgi:hypothetical protein